MWGSFMVTLFGLTLGHEYHDQDHAALPFDRTSINSYFPPDCWIICSETTSDGGIINVRQCVWTGQSRVSC